MEEKINKIQKISIIALILSIIILIIGIAPAFSIKKEDTTNNNTTTEETSNYDVSMFKTLNTKEVVDLFNNKKSTYVVYVGRSTCSACASFLQTLQAMQNKYYYVTQYLDITTVVKDTDEYNSLMNKLSTEVTISVNGEKTTKKFSEYFGYTPMTFIIKNGKFADGIVGAYSEAKFEEFLNNNGIK